MGCVYAVSAQAGANNPDVYSVIENYPTFNDAAKRKNRLASVAMELTSAADGTYPRNAKPARRIYIAGRGSSCCMSTRVELLDHLTTLTLTVTSLDTAPSRSATV